MKNFSIAFILSIFSSVVFAQKKVTGIVLDKETKKPIEFVNIYNSSNFTITNEDGKFDFSSKKDSITFSLLGYTSLKTTINQLPNDSIIYIEPKAFELDEVVVNNKKSTLKKMAETINSYTPESYNEEFFLRTVLKKNDSILKIQDINGVVNRKVLFSTTENPISKKNYTVYVNNMRKAGYEEANTYFKLYDFNKLLTEFVTVSISLNAVKISKKELKDTNLSLLELEPMLEEDNFKNGHYIINTEDNSLHNVFWAFEVQGEFEKSGHLKFRTTKHDLNVTFFKSPKNNQYRIKNAKKNFTVECYYKESQKIIYEVTYIYKTKEFNQNIIARNKVSTKKDIFKLKHPFNEEYWNNNPNLKLTNEMVNFIDELKKSTKKTITNFKK